MHQRALDPLPIPSYRVLGFLRGDFGLAVAARNTLEALAASGRVASPVALERATFLPRPRLPRRLPAGGARALNVFHANPLEVAGHLREWDRLVGPTDWNVGVPFWELPLVPLEWKPVLSAMDAVLAPTGFIQSACASCLPPERILPYPQAVFLPEVAPARDVWGIARDATVFAVSFDIGSDFERKNPLAAVEAFQRAFARQDDVRLVVKMKPWPSVPAFRASAAALEGRVRSDRRISVIDRTLTFGEVLQLYASCDVLVSLHRSEGLGLHLMEAMSLGKAVVATGWSGNTDFMTSANSCPVGYRLVPVETRHPSYRSELGRPGQVWASPDMEGAVEALRSLHQNRNRRSQLGEAAARDMEARRRYLTSGQAFEKVEARLGGARESTTGRLRRAAWRTSCRMVRRAIHDRWESFAARLSPGQG